MTAPLSAPFPARVLRLLALALAFAAAALLPAPALHAQSVAIALSNLERTYTAAEAALDPETDILITPSESGPYTVTITYPGRRTAPRDVGAYPVRIVATSQANPALTATTTGTLVIAKAPLIATPNNQARLFGAPNSPLTLRYEGFLGADTERVLNRRPATTTPARTSSPAGDYAITATGGSDNNYTITLGPPATLTIVPAFPGTYEALLYPFAETETPSGKLTLTLPAAGTTFTGRLDLAELGTPLPLTGKLTPTPDLSGATAFAERRLSTGTTHRVEFTITPAGLSATLFTREPGDTENNPSSLTVDTPTRLVTYPRVAPHPAAGTYTAALLNPTTDGFSFFFPEGSGFASASLSPSGLLKLSGKLADGTPLTASALADAAAPDAPPAYRFRLFLRPYGSRPDSFLAGDCTLKPHPDEDRPGLFVVTTPGVSTDTLSWRKARKPSGTPDKLYPDGFGTLSVNFHLDPWTPPARARAATSTTEATPAITLAQRLFLASTETVSGFADLTYGSNDLGDRMLELPSRLEFTPANKTLPLLATPPANPRAWKFSASTTSGRFTGGFRLDDTIPAATNPEATRPFRRNITFQGILRQPPAGDPIVGAGYFLVTDLPLPESPESATRSTPLTLRAPLEFPID